MGVFLAYVSPEQGRSLLDREFYLPREWAEDAIRRQAAGIPIQRTFATKPELARQMLERAISTKIPFKWVTSDEVYGGNRCLRIWLEQHDIFFALAVATNEPLFYNLRNGQGPGQAQADQIANSLPTEAWQRLSCGEGAKGPRIYDWALAH
ncbi:transposase (plasmid) [Candidatus Chlorohelix allophototropha]|uniref:Transposase n=1 Tax=Candidatus Chlorohelix allophototropha TaxID=3003348 RepID=A0ABY9BBB8_9CHLR|nr:transposase [Chloroflexota bacterium L227-S17]